MSIQSKNIVFVAGEASGDMHAAEVISCIKSKDPSLSIIGMGSSKMKDAGAELFYDSSKIAVTGFLEVIKHYGTIRKAFYLTLKKIKELQPKAVVLVDYPGFNLRLAKKIKKMNLPDTKIIYYVSPQIWAWKKDRIHTIRKYIDKMLVIFDFEKKLYDEYDMDSSFVGHPLLDEVIVRKDKDDFLKSVGLHPFKFTIGLLPGSRDNEITKLLPPMIDAVKLIKQDFPMVQFLLMKAPSVDASPLNSFNSDSFDIKIVEGHQYDAMNACDICIVTSGTATLEVAILNKPMVIIYKTSLFTWIIAKLFIKIPHLGLVNIIGKGEVVPELLQYAATGENIAKEVKKMIDSEEISDTIRTSLSHVRSMLGAPGASKNTAEEILRIIN